MRKVELSDSELQAVNEVVTAVTATYDSVGDPEFVRLSTVLAHDLPERLRAELNAFRLEAFGEALFIRGFDIDDVGIGPTPAHWRTATGRTSTINVEVYFMLCAALLGRHRLGDATGRPDHARHIADPGT